MPIVGERPRGWNFFSSGPARPFLSRLKTSMSYSSLSSSRSQMIRWARDFSSLETSVSACFEKTQVC